jgi:hypothetical protein
MLQHNFERHYTTNKAPLSLSFDPAWLISNKGFDDTFSQWMSHVLSTYNDVYFVTELQVLFTGGFSNFFALLSLFLSLFVALCQPIHSGHKPVCPHF